MESDLPAPPLGFSRGFGLMSSCVLGRRVWGKWSSPEFLSLNRRQKLPKGQLFPNHSLVAHPTLAHLSPCGSGPLYKSPKVIPLLSKFTCHLHPEDRELWTQSLCALGKNGFSPGQNISPKPINCESFLAIPFQLTGVCVSPRLTTFFSH